MDNEQKSLIDFDFGGEKRRGWSQSHLVRLANTGRLHWGALDGDSRSAVDVNADHVLECSALHNDAELESELAGWVGLCCRISADAPDRLEWETCVDLGVFAFWTGREQPADADPSEPGACGSDWAAVQLGYKGSPQIARAYSADGSLCAVLIGHNLRYVQPARGCPVLLAMAEELRRVGLTLGDDVAAAIANTHPKSNVDAKKNALRRVDAALALAMQHLAMLMREAARRQFKGTICW